MRALPFVILFSLAGCADFPQLDLAIPVAESDAPFPALVPIDQLIAQGSATGQITPQSEADAATRAAVLRARAAGLRGPVVDAATRDRLAEAARRAALR